MNIKLGIAPINWCNDDDPNLGKDISFEQCISEMAEAGYTCTELGNKFPRDPKILKPALESHGLQLSSAWFSTYFTESNQYQKTLADFMDHLSFLKAMGARYINICECGHAIQGTDKPIFSNQKPVFTQEQWQLLIQGLHAIGRIAYDHSMQLVYHYHAGTGVFTSLEIDYLMQHTSPSLISLLLDTGHAAFAGINSLDIIEKYHARIRYVHLKDIRLQVLDQMKDRNYSFMDGVRAGVFTVPGDGSLDFAPILQKLHHYGYDGTMLVEAEQDPAKANPLRYAIKAYDYLTKIYSSREHNFVS